MNIPDPPEQGRTRAFRSGDRLVFRFIPPGQTEATPVRYYEEMLDRTYRTPDGREVRLNALGDVGGPPRMCFCFTQDDEHNVWLYGMLIPNPADQTSFLAEEWVGDTEKGYALNYPGLHYVGLTWDTRYSMRGPDGSLEKVDCTSAVEEVEPVTVPAGTFQAFRIVTRERSGELNNLSWFAPELGINVKKISSTSQRPGYELQQWHFAD